MNDAGADGEQTAHGTDANWLFGWRVTPQEWRVWRLWLAVYFSAIGVHVISMFVPALGQISVVLGITVETGLQWLIYSMAATVLLRIFIPLYWRACRTPPAAWWQWVIPLGVMLWMAGTAVFLSGQLLVRWQGPLNDALLTVLFVCGLSASTVGLALFAAGNVGLIRAIRRRQRALVRSRTDQTQHSTPLG